MGILDLRVETAPALPSPVLVSFLSTLALSVLATDPCAGPLDRDGVARCARAVSPRIIAAAARVEAAEGRGDAARVVLSGNPTVTVTANQRWNTAGDRGVNVSGQLSQPVEIAGQRRARRDLARAETRASQLRADATERDVVARALLAYFDVLAAAQEHEIVTRGLVTARRIAAVTHARTAEGLGMRLDDRLADADVAALESRAAMTRGELRISTARLATALGQRPGDALPEIRGGLDPVEVPAGLEDSLAGAAGRPELAALEAEVDAAYAAEGLLRRARVPSLSLSIFAQTDGFNERLLGGGVSLPIPLPFPLGKTNRGELRTARAHVEQARAGVDVAAREVSLEVAVAFHDYQAHDEAAAAYDPAAEADARAHLDQLAAELERGTLPLRDALASQHVLLEMLLSAVHARHARCRASVALALAAQTPLASDQAPAGDTP